ncbi:response regulator transcription factor [Bradyrhizobium sp. PMVTL-01]|uniref:response regulator transcription factor n=1 Tax=Bradyrhizobium sp. PMVTL-01 TaxID=3434999 RepID=UPI003F704DE0
MRVLLIEKDPAVAQSIELWLKSERFNVYTTDDGEEGLDLAKLYDYDIVICGNTPSATHDDTVLSMRKANVRTPVIVLANRNAPELVARSLSRGADDYTSSPFHRDEMVARIHAVVRRSKGHAASTIQTGSMLLNLDTRTVSVDGQSVPLTGKEYQMLELLSLRKGTTLTKEMFLNHLYGGMDEPELKIIDVFICKLRKKLSRAGLEAGDVVRTIWGRGYMLEDPVVEKVGLGPPTVSNPVGFAETV